MDSGAEAAMEMSGKPVLGFQIVKQRLSNFVSESVSGYLISSNIIIKKKKVRALLLLYKISSLYYLKKGLQRKSSVVSA